MMTDHQQAAIEAAEDALRADIWDGDPEDIPPTMGREAELAVAAAEPHLRKKWAEEWGIGDETSRPLYDARLRIGELEGEVHNKDREIRILDFELNSALDLLEAARRAR